MRIRNRRKIVRIGHEKRNLFIFLLFVFFMGIGYSIIGTDVEIGGSIIVKKPKEPTIRYSYSSDKRAFKSDTYREYIKIINLSDRISPPTGSIASWDISSSQDGSVMAYIKKNATNSSYYDLYIQGDGHLYANQYCDYMFANLKGLDAINNLDVLDTSKVTRMKYMFSQTGYDSSSFKLDLGNNFDTKNVTDMSYMFFQTGENSTSFTLNLGSKFNTIKVTDMSDMFAYAGYQSPIFTLDLGNLFDTRNVTNMGYMFAFTGMNSTRFELKLGNNFDTSKVTNMNTMFINVGRSNSNFKFDLGDKFNTSLVTNMSFMFSYMGYNNNSFKLDIGTLSFDSVQYRDTVFGGFKTTNKVIVKDSAAKSWVLNNGGNSNLTNSNVFLKTDYYMLDASYEYDDSYFRDNYRLEIKTITFNNSINPPSGYIDSWDISVGHCGGVMAYVVPNSLTPSMYDLHIQGDGRIYANTDSSYWFSRLYYVEAINNINVLNTSLTVNMSHMFDGIGSAGDATSFSMDINFDTSHVTDMSYMFQDFETGEISFTFGDKFDTSDVTDMEGMFCYAAYIIGTRIEADLSSFTFNATSYYNMFGGWQANYKIYVNDSTARDWILNNSDNSDLTTSNVLIKT